MNSKSGKVFISHSSKDAEVASEVCSFLESNGVECWIAPRNIDPGANYATQIVQGIRSCSAMVLLASDNTNASGHVSNEVSLAFDNKKLIIPFKIQDIVFTDEYLYFLGRKHWIEAHLNFEKGLDQLLATMSAAGIVVVHEVNNPAAPDKIQEINVNIDDDANIEEKEEIFSEKTKPLSREEISKKILNLTKVFSEKSIYYLEGYGDFEGRKSIVNRFLDLSYSVFRHNKKVETSDCIGYLLNEILGDNEEEVIKVSGLPGTGKSVLLQTAFYQALMMFKEGTSKYVPFYIGLGHYERMNYESDQFEQRVKDDMLRDMAFYFEYLDSTDEVEPVLFVDEVREHIVGKIHIESILAEILRNHSITKRVVSVDSGLVLDKHRVKRVIPIISERISSTFLSHQINLHDEQLSKEFIQSITELFDYDVAADEVFWCIKKLKYQEIDVYTVRTIADELAASPSGITNISDLYEKWALTELQGSEEKLFEVAASTYQYLFGVDYRLVISPTTELQWRLIHKHRSYIDFLLAYYLIKQIESYDAGTDASKLFMPMLTASTDRFLGAYLAENYSLQEKTLDAVIDNFDSFGNVQKSSALFWLAKVSYKNLTADAIDFLRKQFVSLKTICKGVDDTSQSNYDNQFLFRAVCFSLIVHGQNDVLDDYLCLLVTNDSANAINRGAIVEYYGDQFEMANNGTYCLDTNPLAGDTAVTALNWKVSNALRRDSTKYPELDLLTLSTMLQSRIQCASGKHPDEIVEWVEDIVDELSIYRSRPQNIKSEKIEYYFGSIYEDFTDFLHKAEGFDIGQMIYGQLQKLSEVKRKQWMGQGLQDVESVSEHTYSAWMMAMLFLPQTMERTDYSKQEVLDMLLIHDMAEAILGDQVLTLSEPSHELRTQNDVMRKLFVKGSYSSLANLTYYYNIWTGYYKGLNINAKIARDFNVIQTVYTFCNHYIRHPDSFTEDDRKQWKMSKRMLQTNPGYDVYERIIENNTQFRGIF